MGERLADAVEWLYPSAGALLVGTLLIIAIISAVLVYLLDAYGERKQRGRELKGLLRILDMEIAANERFLRLLDEYPTWLAQAPAHSLGRRAWEDVRVDLAHLLKDYECFEAIANYYEKLQEVDKGQLSAGSLESFGEARQQGLRHELHIVLELSDIARGRIHKHF